MGACPFLPIPASFHTILLEITRLLAGNNKKARLQAGNVRYFSSVASLRPMSTPITDAIISPRVQPLESPSEKNP